MRERYNMTHWQSVLTHKQEGEPHRRCGKGFQDRFGLLSGIDVETRQPLDLKGFADTGSKLGHSFVENAARDHIPGNQFIEFPLANEQIGSKRVLNGV